ncbi:DUF2892 domain-containing protein [Acidithiobacillus sp. AMEEHan]|uniref:YgaP family membrane protein n=1 Tax=Acidithiobacillus sp. AMEEHan TaxID=2994951 RepID=UPI0027E3BBA3|nr:DUF2892 domain-containing protein [Acidithiobacillus sp. AMEEHan]
MGIRPNMLPIERWLRLYFGVILLAIYFMNPFPYKEWTFSGLLLIATAATGYCPIYSLLRRRKRRDRSSAIAPGDGQGESAR